MKLIETKCPNCGSSIEVENNRKKAKCEYCETSFSVEDNVIEIKHKHLMAGEISEEQEFINAETNLNKFKNYDDAYTIYLSLSKRYVDHSEVWIGLLRCVTKDFTYKYGSAEFKKMYQMYWDKFSVLSSEKEKKEYEDKYQNYDENLEPTNRMVQKKEEISKEKCYLAITVLGGMFGIHKFIRGEIILGFIYLFTLGLFGIGWIIDIVREYKKCPDSPQKQVVKWVLFVFLVFMAIEELPYSTLSVFMYLLTAVLCIDPLWKKFKINNKYLRIFVPFAIFCIGINYASTSIPVGSYGTWVVQYENPNIVSTYEMYEFGDDGCKLYERDGDKEYVNATTDYYDSKIYVNAENGYTSVLLYRAFDEEMCLLNERNECVIKFKKIVGDKEKQENQES